MLGTGSDPQIQIPASLLCNLGPSLFTYENLTYGLTGSAAACLVVINQFAREKKKTLVSPAFELQLACRPLAPSQGREFLFLLLFGLNLQAQFAF